MNICLYNYYYLLVDWRCVNMITKALEEMESTSKCRDVIRHCLFQFWPNTLVSATFQQYSDSSPPFTYFHFSFVQLVNKSLQRFVSGFIKV